MSSIPIVEAPNTMFPFARNFPRVMAAGPLSLALLAGCGTGALSPPQPVSPAPVPTSPAFTGSVHAGNKPVSGAAIQLYAASVAAYGASSSPLLLEQVTTESDGTFSVSGRYTCPSASSQVYLVATGGNPGLASGTNNTALAFMSAFGNCGDLASTTVVQLNELTTVAAVWPLAHFMTNEAGVGTRSTNALGLHNAFLNSAKLVNTATGLPVPSDPTTATPVQTIIPGNNLNTLANILAGCSSTAGTAPGSPCANLFAAATAGTGAHPSNTITAALAIALHPTINIATLFKLSSVNAPFQPALSAAPPDWLLSIGYLHNELYGYLNAVDGLGNLWNVGYYNLNSFILGVGQTEQIFHNHALEEPTALAIDAQQNLW